MTMQYDRVIPGTMQQNILEYIKNVLKCIKVPKNVIKWSIMQYNKVQHSYFGISTWKQN